MACDTCRAVATFHDPSLSLMIDNETDTTSGQKRRVMHASRQDKLLQWVGMRAGRPPLALLAWAMAVLLAGCAAPIPLDEPVAGPSSSSAPAAGKRVMRAGTSDVSALGSASGQRVGAVAAPARSASAGADAGHRRVGPASGGGMRQRGRSAVVAPHCVFTPSHGTADGRTIPPAYECEHLSRAQHAAGRCQEVAGYEREDGTYVPGHTRCLVDPRAPAWAVQDRDTPLAAPLSGSPAEPPATGSMAAGQAPASSMAGKAVDGSATGAAARAGSLAAEGGVQGATKAEGAALPVGGAFSSRPGTRPAVEAMQPSTILRADPSTDGGSPAATELVLPSDDAGGIDQGNDTFVRPITAPGSLSGH